MLAFYQCSSTMDKKEPFHSCYNNCMHSEICSRLNMCSGPPRKGSSAAISEYKYLYYCPHPEIIKPPTLGRAPFNQSSNLGRAPNNQLSNMFSTLPPLHSLGLLPASFVCTADYLPCPTLSHLGQQGPHTPLHPFCVWCAQKQPLGLSSDI
jgi:hypothetical protein